MRMCNEAEVKQAFIDCVLENYQSVPEENKIKHTFSYRFKKKMNTLIQQMKGAADKETTYHLSKRAIRIVALIAIMIAIALY